ASACQEGSRSEVHRLDRVAGRPARHRRLQDRRRSALLPECRSARRSGCQEEVSIMRKLCLALMLSMSAVTANAQTAAAEYGSGSQRFSLATGSPGELGLLKVLGEAFGKEADARLVWIKAGTGQSMQFLKERKVDMAMVHAPAQVDKAIADGWATGKTLIGSNEFYIVGPASDPAGITKARDAADAYARIAAAKARFVSRGDNSGTHQKELQV